MIKAYFGFRVGTPLPTAVQAPLQRLRSNVVKQATTTRGSSAAGSDDAVRLELALRQIDTRTVPVLGVYMTDTWQNIARHVQQREATIFAVSADRHAPAQVIDDEATRDRLATACDR